MKNNKTTFRFPLPILVGEGKLITDAATAHPEVAGRLDKDCLTLTATVLGNVKTQAADQKQKRGQTGILSKAQLDKIHAFHLLVANAKKTAKLAFPKQTVMLRASFQVGVHKPHDLQSQLQRGRTVLASLQAQENIPALTKQRLDGGRNHGAGQSHQGFGKRQDAAGSRQGRRHRLNRPEERAGGGFV
jgi:hypothetical protein